jgi:hypothetical protein
MQPEEKRLVEQLRAAIAQKKDAAERDALLEKLATVERYLEDQPRLQREAEAAQARLRSARRTLFWAKVFLGLMILAIVAAFVVALR